MNNSTPDSGWSSTCPAVVIDSRRISPDDTDEVRVIRLGIADPAFRFQEGQTIGVLVPGPHAFGTKPHHRYYSIANARDKQADDEIEIQIIVRRCFYIDEISGEQFPGIASNYLCDANSGDPITLTGPYKSVFNMPKARDSNLLMIGSGTGIAPFRAFIQHIYSTHQGWDGKVRLFFGDKNGLDLLYMNDVDSDLAYYYVNETFEAYQSISNKYGVNADEALELTLEEHATEAWGMLQDPKTHVFLAGTRKASEALDNILVQLAGSTETWDAMRQKMKDENRWSELLYL